MGRSRANRTCQVKNHTLDLVSKLQTDLLSQLIVMVIFDGDSQPSHLLLPGQLPNLEQPIERRAAEESKHGEGVARVDDILRQHTRQLQHDNNGEEGVFFMQWPPSRAYMDPSELKVLSYKTPSLRLGLLGSLGFGGGTSTHAVTYLDPLVGLLR